MKIGIDLHNTITSDPNLFERLMRNFKAAHSKIIIISGPPRNKIIEELMSLNISSSAYTDIISVVDFLLRCGHPHEIDEDKNYHFNNKPWWESKALICAAHNIDLMIDDKEEYGRHFIGKCRFFLVKPSGLGCPKTHPSTDGG